MKHNRPPRTLHSTLPLHSAPSYPRKLAVSLLLAATAAAVVPGCIWDFGGDDPGPWDSYGGYGGDGGAPSGTTGGTSAQGGAGGLGGMGGGGPAVRD